MSVKQRILIAAGVVVVAAVGVGTWIYTTLDDQTKTTATSELDDFRASIGPAQPDRPGLPKQGIYEYAVTGDEVINSRIKVERTLPTTATMLVRHRADGYETETLYSKEHTEMSRYELQDQGAFVTFAVTKLVVGPINTTRERSWSPKLLRLPLDREKADATWGGDFTAGTLKLAITNRLLPEATVDVGGTPVKAIVIESTQAITGEYTGDRVETFWYSPENSLVVKYKIDSSLKGPTDLDFNVEQTLASLEPQV